MNPEAAAQLQEGINLLLSRWAALRIAVENEWGGRYSHLRPQQLGRGLFHHLTQDQVHVDDLKEMLNEFMLSLNTEIGDGSIEEIAEMMMVMHEECLEGKFDSIMKLRETNVPPLDYIRQPGSDDEDTIDDDEEDDDSMDGERSTEMEVDTPQPNRNQNSSKNDELSVKEEPEVVDGWTVVSSKRNKGRRN